MKNPSMEETIFEAVLTRAFADAAAEELAELERDCPAEVEYPEKYRKIERKAYRKRWGSGGFRWSQTMQRAAVWILAVGLVGGALVMTVPEVRAGFNNLVATAFEKYVCFESAASAKAHVDMTGGYRFEYIPENYEQTDHYKTNGEAYTFQNPMDGQYFTISYHPSDSTSIGYDNEYSTFTQYSIGGNIAYLISYEDDIVKDLIWNDGEMIFTISGTISEEMMLKIARNIFRIE